MTSEAELSELLRHDGCYHTAERRQPWFAPLPGSREIRVYGHYVLEAIRVGTLAMCGRFSQEVLRQTAGNVLISVEAAGGSLHIEGVHRYRDLEGGAVIVSNHMSTLETALLLHTAMQYKEMTFVLKESLLKYPFFRNILMQLQPIQVTRKDARTDLRRVMDQAPTHLQTGRCLVVFPQSTRSTTVDPKAFNTLGVKIAQRAGVPVVPVALKTDFWSIGKFVRDFGRIHPERPVHLAVGEPFLVDDPHAAQQRILDWIIPHLDQWHAEAGE